MVNGPQDETVRVFNVSLLICEFFSMVYSFK